MIFLCGPMGCGKSAIGEKLAEIKGYSFVDSDALIVKLKGDGASSLGELIGRWGFDLFRRYEEEVIRHIVGGREDTVVALGGGALRAKTAPLILGRDHSLTVWPKIPFESCLKRASQGKNRPLMALSREELEKIYRERIPYYEKSHLIIEAHPNWSVDKMAFLLESRIDDFLKKGVSGVERIE